MTDNLILYASQTGNCEQISEDLCEQILTNGKIKLTVKKPLTLNSSIPHIFTKSEKLKVLIIICSSTGDGDLPENGEKFGKLLCKQNFDMSHVYFTILGLGSTDYTKFQGAPIFLEEKMKSMGATSFYYRAEADDAVGLEEVVEPWLEGIQQAVLDV